MVCKLFPSIPHQSIFFTHVILFANKLKTEEAIKNGQSRNTNNIGYKTKNDDKQTENKTQ